MQNDTTVKLVGVLEIFQHPNYNSKTLNEDLGLLKLNETVLLNEFILPICLPKKSHDDYKAIVSGFGKTGYMQTGSDKVLKVTLEKFTQPECQQKFGTSVTITNNTMICYGHHTERKDSCNVSCELKNV